MSVLKSLRDAILPRRASTMTWMVATFALFVGIAVVAVALYVLLVLRAEMHTAMERSLRGQAERIAAQVEADTSRAERERLIAEARSMTNLHVSITTPDTTLGDIDRARPPVRDRFVDADTLGDAFASMQTAQTRYLRQQRGDGTSWFYAAVFQPDATLIVHVGQSEPPLYELVEGSQLVLILGMVLALVMAIIGSFVAAYQVTAPLKAISDSAKSVARGRITEKINLEHRAKEFQELAESLNQASDTFREKINELERLTSLQSEFIGNVSHEVRNPIFAISGYLEALGTPRLGEQQRKRYAEKALTNLERLQNLFNDLIEIARLEYREDLIKRKVFDLKDLVNEVTEMLRPKAEKKGLDLQVDIPRFMVNADRNRIRQVLVNLIDNAIAYTDEGAVRCRVQRRLDKVRIEIVDTGKGIDEDHLQRIFERFYRVDPDRSRESGGTGLGLSIVKQILQAHGEQIHVESTPGRGTRFWFELPYAEEPEAVEA